MKNKDLRNAVAISKLIKGTKVVLTQQTLDLVETAWRRLADVVSVIISRLPRRLQDVLLRFIMTKTDNHVVIL